jgi:hypothetical protein
MAVMLLISAFAAVAAFFIARRYSIARIDIVTPLLTGVAVFFLTALVYLAQVLDSPAALGLVAFGLAGGLVGWLIARRNPEPIRTWRAVATGLIVTGPLAVASSFVVMLYSLLSMPAS